ncbi:MAG: heparinase II/III family protein [Akkermansiaceae bacterium]|nr:heparinase II/III family protein [Akkermansiaceae bacterium]
MFRYIRTLRYLRPSQWRGQLAVRICKYWRDPARLSGGELPPGRMVSKGGLGELPAPVPPQDPEALKDGDFTFLGETMSLGRSPDWNTPAASRLWRYNLHYFDWLWSLLPEDRPNWETARHFTLDWIEHHPPHRGACGWEPYPTSLRLLNWSLLFGVRHRERTLADPDFWKRLSNSIQQQAQWLEKNLETHIQANHLLENLAALSCVHAIFEWDGRGKSRTRIEKLLQAELDEQILGDGMHYERSPMYHLRMLWLVEALSSVGPENKRPATKRLAVKMKAALALLRHPDGGIPLLNDAALGIYADGWTSEKAQDGPWAQPDAGYYGARAGGDFVVIDAGPIGPDHQPGHAHADFFTFELSLGGCRVVTDTGIETYAVGPARFYDRSTAAHNTVEVEDQDSVEVWGGFRVGRRVQPEVSAWTPGDDGFVLQAQHAGYRHLPSKAIHKRQFSWRPGVFEISDELVLKSQANAVSRLHFAPGVELEVEGDTAHGRVGKISFRVETEGTDGLSLEESVYHPSFNRSITRPVLCLRVAARPPVRAWRVRILWESA